MSQEAHFSVNTRLTRLLGETYRSSEVALKELVDNAWDADARNVWITLPTPVTNESVIVRDDGSGMTALEMRHEYLNIASDKLKRTGERTPRYNRKVKGRKGIGKFAGLTIAYQMVVHSVSRGRKCTLTIDKDSLIENQNDLEAVPLPFSEEPASSSDTGTTVILSHLDHRLNFPHPDKLREVLVHEYGREEQFRVFVNDIPLSVEDVPGTTSHLTAELPTIGSARLSFTIADGKRPPKSPGIILKVNGKSVGRPQLFGLDEDDDIPGKLAKRVYGEIELNGLEDYVTADWGALIENSKAYEEIQRYINAEIKKALQSAYAREMSLQKARIQRQLDLRLQRLPEHRRKYAQEALNRILKRFYGESDERIATIAEVALDAMEHDAYWAVLENISNASHGDIHSFAESLEQFGIVELSTLAVQATRRYEFLDYLEQLVTSPETLEQDAHTAFEKNLWLLGRSHSLLSSNKTLKNIIESYCNTTFKGSRAAKRPDLLLSQDYNDRYVIIEFKRPSHEIDRDDISQAEKYRDDLSPKLTSSAKIDIIMIGKGRSPKVDIKYLQDDISILSYVSIVSAARNELSWLISALESGK